MRILLAIDDSKFSEAATQAVIAQALSKETEVRVLHVTEPLWAVYGGMERVDLVDWQALIREQRAEAESLVTRTAKILRDAGFRVATAVETGIPKAVIVDSATQWPAELIVMGSHGRKGIDRFLMGSVAESVVRHAPCSVQIVRIPAAVPMHLGVSPSEIDENFGNPKGKIQTPTAPEPAQHKQICNVCGKASSSNICPVCADKIRAEAVARKKREDKGEE